MTDHKFTDERIIRCLNECSGKENVVAHIVDQGENELVTLGRLLEIINRQKAEIERLQKHNTEFARKHYSDGYNEAVKKFAERLKELCSDETTDNTNNPCVRILYDAEENIDDLVKEMTEENTHEMQSTNQP